MRDYAAEFDTAATASAARQKFSMKKYDVCIIGGHLPDSSGLGFSVWMRDNMPEKPAVAYVSSGYAEKEKLEHIRKTFPIEYVLKKPVSRDEFTGFLNAVSSGRLRRVTAERNTGFLEALRKKYQQTVGEKTERLGRLIRDIEASPCEATLAAFQKDVHKIAGSAGSYGYARVSALCREMEFDLQKKMVSPDLIVPEWLISLQTFLKKIKLAFQSADAEPAGESQFSGQDQAGESSTLDIYVADDDAALLDIFRKKSQVYGLKTQVETDPLAAKQAVEQNGFAPKFLLVSKYYAGYNGIDGYDIIKEFRAHHRFAATAIGIISSDGEMDNRLSATKAGVELFLKKPVQPESFDEIMKKFIEPQNRKRFRVLLVDDDIDVCEYVSTILYRIGVDVKAVFEGKNLIAEIESFGPDLLILDIALPDYGGLELLQMLRSDLRYKHIPVVILTEHADNFRIKMAYFIGAEDFIVKPIVRELFQARIVNQMNRKTLMDAAQNRDYLTGLYNRRAFSDIFRNSVVECEKTGGKLAFAMINLDGYNEINEQYGHSSGDDVLIRFGKFLSNSLRKSDVIGRWGGDEFTILMQGTNLTYAQFLMGLLLEDWRNEAVMEKYPDKRLSFSCGMAVFPDNGGTLEALSRAADKALRDAKKEGKARVVISRHTGTSRMIRRPEIAVLSRDQLAAFVLRTAYEARGFRITLYDGVSAAVDNIKSRGAGNMPVLMVIDRDLGAEDGLDILKSLPEVVKANMPAIAVSSRITEAEVLRGLKAGAVDCLPKPLSLPILMEKSLKILSK